MLNMIWYINQQTMHLNGRWVVVHDDNMKLINKVNYGMNKAIEYAQDAAAPISKIITIIRKSLIRYEF